jgi:hypothetical protein
MRQVEEPETVMGIKDIMEDSQKSGKKPKT